MIPVSDEALDARVRKIVSEEILRRPLPKAEYAIELDSHVLKNLTSTDGPIGAVTIYAASRATDGKPTAPITIVWGRNDQLVEINGLRLNAMQLERLLHVLALARRNVFSVRR